MTISRKRTTGAAIAGSALVFGAVFTPVAAFAVEETPVEGEQDGIQALAVTGQTSQPVYTTAESAAGISWSASGLTPNAAYEVALTLPNGSELDVPAEDGNAQTADAEGLAGGLISWDDNSAFDVGVHSIRVTEVGNETNTVTFSFTVSDEVQTEEPTPSESETEEPTPSETETEEPTPSETETEEPTPSETEAEETEQTLTLAQDTYTVAESVNGVEYIGTGFAPSTAFVLWVKLPGETAWTEVTYTPDGETDEQVSDGEGVVVGSLNFYNLDTGVAVEFPEGTYGVRVTQEVDGEELSADASFTVGEASTTEPTPTEDEGDNSETPVPTQSEDDSDDTTGNNGNQDGELAQTGADDMLPVFLAGGLVLMAAGAGLFVVRRRMDA